MAPTDAAAEVTPQKGSLVISFATTTTTTQTIPPSPIIIKNLVTDIKDLRQGTNIYSILKEFKWHQKDTPNFTETVLLIQTSPMIFTLMKVRTATVHSVGKFSGNPFNPAKYQGQMIGFVGFVFRL